MINNLNNNIKKHTKKANNEKWNELCHLLAEQKPPETTFWKTIKKIETGNIMKDSTILPGVNCKQEKSNKMGHFYSTIFTNRLVNNNENLFNYSSQNKYSIPITLSEIKDALKTTAATKSFGDDQLSFNDLKKMPEECLKYLELLYNYSFTHCYFPNCWKTAKIKVLRKKDVDLDNPASYRPISLLRTISRLLEKVVNRRLMEWAEDENILHKNQSGFRKHRSTQDIKILETCKTGIQRNKKCGIVLFDIEKAFDKAPHNGILLQLHKYKCPPIIGKWLATFLTNRKFFVEIEETKSERLDIKAGVPQGSPLSPLLFSLFINEIGSKLDKINIKFALFADDLTIWEIDSNIKNIQKRLQDAISIINHFFTEIGLKINKKKCEYCILTSQNEPIYVNLYINNNKIVYNPNPKILGIYLDPQLKFKYHFDLTLIRLKWCRKDEHFLNRRKGGQKDENIRVI
jgi:hypothetical protein